MKARSRIARWVDDCYRCLDKRRVGSTVRGMVEGPPKLTRARTGGAAALLISCLGFQLDAQAACPPNPCTPGNQVGRDFFVQVVGLLSDVPMNNLAVDALVDWAPFENTECCWNPLATTRHMEVVCTCSTAPVQSYQSQNMGAQATALTLNLAYYDAIRRMLRQEAFDREALRTALSSWTGDCAYCDGLLDRWQKLWNQGTYSLARGLNLISFPFTPKLSGSSRFSDIFGSLGSDLFPYVFYLTPKGTVTFSSIVSLDAEPKRGYIVFLENPRTITISGDSVDPSVILNSGLNFVGVKDTVIPSPNPQTFPYAFSYQNGQIVVPRLFQDGLAPRLGYFIFSSAANNVLIPATQQPATSAWLADEKSPSPIRYSPMPAGCPDDGFTASVLVQQAGASNTVTLKFGVKSTATTNFDDGLDEVRDLPFPGSLDGFFDDGVGVAMKTDYKPAGLTNQWPFTVFSQAPYPEQPTNLNPVRLSWMIPSHGTVSSTVQFQLLDGSGNVVVPDMRATAEVTFPVNDASTEKGYVVRATSLSSPVTFTTDSLISAGSNGYDGQDIIVSGCTLTIDGPHSFNSLWLTNAATLTHSPAPDGEICNQINLAITQDFVVDGSSRVEVSALGFAAAAGPGAGGSSTNSGASGGGHGGLGGVGPAGASVGAAYDAILAPTQPGSGGGNGYFSSGGNGGGVVRLAVGGALRLNGGTIRADGSGSGGSFGGGGSGGTIALTVGQLLGFGAISANGGGATGGGGGAGGCIAINCTNNPFTGLVSAYGGPGLQYGGAGTVFIKTGSQSAGELRVHNGGNAGQYTPLLSPALYNLTVAGSASVYPLASLTNANVTIKSSGLLTHLSGQCSIDLTVLSNLVIEAGGRLDASGKGYAAGLGPGAGGSSAFGGGGGAGYGGIGGDGGNTGAQGGGAYDSIVAPARFGSGGGNGYFSVGGSGGGAVWLAVAGTLQVDGVLKADGSDSFGYIYGGGGAGGALNLSVGTLAGGGSISANGGAGAGSGGGGGAGGRIALYFTSNYFTGVLSAYGGGGTNRGGAGTIFTQSSGAPHGQVLLDNGGNAGGLTRLNTAFWPGTALFDLTVAGAAKMVADMPLTFGDFIVTSGATVSHDPGQGTLQIVALQDARIDAGSSINANGLGYGVSSGPGAGADLASGGGGGGGYGGEGGTGLNGGTGGGTYGSASQPLDLGSGGGSGFVSTGGAGGGFVRVSAGRVLQVNGTITANGAQGPPNLYGGGGSGGSIFLTAGVLSGSGLITANGGAAYRGGGGGGGRIATYGGILVDLPTTPTALGGLSGDGSDTNRNGRAGTVFTSTNVPPFQVVSVAPSGPVTHSVSSVAVTFNAGVISNSFAPASVLITTPSGPVPQDQITVTPAGGPVFSVSIPIQTAPGDYSVQIGPDIQDLFGREMDQNGNGIRGEPADVFTDSFTIASPVTISGAVRYMNGTPVPNVLLQAGTNASTLSASDGSYTLTLPQGWSGDVTPSKAGCVLSPANRSYTNLTTSVGGQDYTLTIAFAPNLRASVQGTTLHVEWSSIVGIQYQMQTSTDLFGWANAGQPISGTGGTLSWNFDATSNPGLFVRVIANN